MMRRALFAAFLSIGFFVPHVRVQEAAGASGRYRALKYPPPSSLGTWAILDFDGARRDVEPYLSSLGGGETGTGRIVSPEFTVAGDAITFTLCGHDGRGGGHEKNFIALVDARSGDVLQKTPAPGNDALAEHTWDVASLRGRPVHIEVRDGIDQSAFAWLGVGRIDAGPAFTVDFREALPADWEVVLPPREERTEVVAGSVPFRRRPAVYSLVPREGEFAIACGFRAERIFFLGGVVQRGKPLETYGTIEIVYRTGPAERFPLMFGYTLDGELKLPSPSKTMHVHRSGDVFQHYFAVGPRSEVIERIVLRGSDEHKLVPRITAITCQTSDGSENLEPLPDAQPGAEEAAWIRSHTITAEQPDMEAIAAAIRRAHKM